MTRSLYGLTVLLALLIAGLAACDSSTGPSGPDLTGYTGAPDLLGMWTPGRKGTLEDFRYYAYDPSTRLTTVTLHEYNYDTDCSSDPDTLTLSNVTVTSYILDREEERYSISGTTLSLQGRSNRDLERSSRTPASLTAGCD